MLSWLGQWPEIEIIVVEQDAVPRLDAPLEYSGGVARFAYNPGPFNKAWGLNVALGFARGPVLAIGDADVLAPHTLAAAVERCRDIAAVKPYRTIVDLTPEETARVRAGEWDLRRRALPTRFPIARAKASTWSSPAACSSSSASGSFAWVDSTSASAAGGAKTMR